MIKIQSLPKPSLKKDKKLQIFDMCSRQQGREWILF